MRRVRNPIDELFASDLADILDDNSLEGIFDFITKPVKAIVKGVGGAAKVVAKGVGKVVTSAPFKLVMPISALTQTKLAQGIGNKIPIVKDAIKAQNTALGMIKKIGDGKNVSKNVLDATKQAVNKANVLSAQAKQAATAAGALAPTAAIKQKALAAVAGKRSSGAVIRPAPRDPAKARGVPVRAAPLDVSSASARARLVPQLKALASTMGQLNLGANADLIRQLHKIAST